MNVVSEREAIERALIWSAKTLETLQWRILVGNEVVPELRSEVVPGANQTASGGELKVGDGDGPTTSGESGDTMDVDAITPPVFNDDENEDLLLVCIRLNLIALAKRAPLDTVQIEGQPFILTGAPAPNKVLGREVYASNLQLGGTQIMYKNDVSHLTASSDLEGTHILQWLSCPKRQRRVLPIRETPDSWDREISYAPPKGPYNPRWLLDGKTDKQTTQHLSGFFDKGSFQETLGE